MKTESLVIATVFTILGIGIGYIFFNQKGEEVPLPCAEGEIYLANCISKDATFMEVNQDSLWINYYRNSISQDAVGFSLNKDLLKKLYLTVENSSGIGVDGVRLYPGLDDNQRKLLIVKPLRTGTEISNLGFLIQENLGDNGGPCPKWCNNSSRIILPD